MTVLLVASTGVLTAGLVWSEYRGTPTTGRLLKIAASTGFIAVALSVGAATTPYGRFVLAALALSWIGDLLLTFVGRIAFLAALLAFLAAHLAYVAGFAIRGLDLPWLVVPGVVLTVVAIRVWRWLGPHVSNEMRFPVVAYIFVITSMVAAAFSTTAAIPDVRIPLGAAAFYLSDIAVARNRFVAPGPINRAAGLPLYYGGQVLLALSAAS